MGSARNRRCLLGDALGALAMVSDAAFEAWAADPDPCKVSADGTTATCEGNQSAGINLSALPPSVRSFSIRNLSTAITPPNGAQGILYQSIVPAGQQPRSISSVFDADYSSSERVVN